MGTRHCSDTEDEYFDLRIIARNRGGIVLKVDESERNTEEKQ